MNHPVALTLLASLMLGATPALAQSPATTTTSTPVTPTTVVVAPGDVLVHSEPRYNETPRVGLDARAAKAKAPVSTAQAGAPVITLDAPSGYIEAVTLRATIAGQPGFSGMVMLSVVDANGMTVNGALVPITLDASGKAVISEVVSQDEPSPTFTFIADLQDAAGQTLSTSKWLGQVVDSKIFGTSPAGDVTPQYVDSVVRVSGPTRIDTAVKASVMQFNQGAKGVVLVNAYSFADAVTAAPYAAAHDYTLLLTAPTSLSPETAREITRLLPHGGPVVLMGGNAAINHGVEHDLAKLPKMHVTRLAGATRVETSLAIAKAMVADGHGEYVVGVDAQDAPSAIMASPLAARHHGVVLLLDNQTLSDQARDMVIQAAPKRMVIVGNDTFITPSAIEPPSVPGLPASIIVERIAHNDVTQRSLHIANNYFGDAQVVGVAGKDATADGIVGATMMAGKGGPLVLIDPAKETPVLPAFITTHPMVREGLVFGGTKVIDDNVVQHNM